MKKSKNYLNSLKIKSDNELSQLIKYYDEKFQEISDSSKHNIDEFIAVIAAEEIRLIS